MLNSGGGSPPVSISASIPACSIAWRGGSARWTSTLTPQSGAIGRHAPDGSTTAGVHGPAATTTAPAATVRPPTAIPPGASTASSPIASRAPAASARAAKAAVAAAGGTA